jgi:hypothetical protein
MRVGCSQCARSSHDQLNSACFPPPPHTHMGSEVGPAAFPGAMSARRVLFCSQDLVLSDRGKLGAENHQPGQVGPAGSVAAPGALHALGVWQPPGVCAGSQALTCWLGCPSRCS